jgi:NADPH2:quinone reductase
MRLEDLPDPEADGSLRIRIEASGINFFDQLLIAGTYQSKPQLPFIPGGEVAGVVTAAPDGSAFSVGDRVAAMVTQDGLRSGGYADSTSAFEPVTFRLPDSMPWQEGAAFLLTYLTGWFGLVRRAALQPGETLLVHGGAGGVGTAAIQLGKAFGARVMATAGSDAKLEICRRMGADECWNYKETDWVAAVKEATGGRGADVVYDPIGGDVFDRSTKAIAFEGRLIVVGFTSGRIPELRANHVLVKNYSVVGLHFGAYNLAKPELVPQAWAELVRLYEAGKIKPLVSATYPLAEARTALEAVGSGQTTGKVVLTAG